MQASDLKAMLNHPHGIKLRTHRYRNALLSIISLLSILAPQLFFSISGLIGFEYGGVEESPIYVQFIAIIFILVFIAFVLSYRKKPKLSAPEFTFFLFFFALISNHLLWLLFDNLGTQFWPANLTLFFSMGVTGFMAARVIQVYGLWLETIKLTEALMLFIAFCLIVAIVQPFLAGFQVRGIGGASYQAASYYSAMCYGMIGLATFRLPNQYRFRIFHNRFMLPVNSAIMVALFVAVLINGGRGAYVLLVVYTAIIIYWIASKDGIAWNGFIRFIAVLLTVPILFSIALNKILNDSILAAGWQRSIAFIGSQDGALINLEEGSSGRNEVYAVALHGVFESPWIGHGAFSHWEKVTYPHNLFLDLVLQFGIPVALVIIVVVSVTLIQKLRNFRNLRVEQLWLLMLFLNPLVKLMVSGGYLRDGLFWFCLMSIFLLSKSLRKNRLKSRAFPS